jgi:type II secretory pathway pseudopilin PulG
MKMNKTATKLKPGMTLIEITVVILVLLTLIAVLFIGANIYKKGADRAACILNIRNIQQAVRADQNLNNKREGEPIYGNIMDSQVGTGGLTDQYFEEEVLCPEDTEAVGYTWASANYPVLSSTAVSCAIDTNHAPNDTSGW